MVQIEIYATKFIPELIRFWKLILTSGSLQSCIWL